MNYYETDTEFMERLEQFAFHEVVNEEGQQLDAPTRWLAVLAALVGCQGIDAYREFLPKAFTDVRERSNRSVKNFAVPIRHLAIVSDGSGGYPGQIICKSVI